MTDGAPAPAPAASPEQQIRAEIDALRTSPYGVGESDLDRAAKLETLYKRLYPEPSGELPPSPSGPTDTPLQDAIPPERLVLPELPAGTEWDRPAVAELYAIAGREALPRSDVAQALGVMAEVVRDPKRWTGDELRSHLIAKHGEARFKDIDNLAGWAATFLPPKLHRDLRQSGLLFHPRFVDELVRLGEKLHDGSTPQGMARLKELYSE